MSRPRLLSALALLGLASACGSSSGPSPLPSPSPSPSASPVVTPTAGNYTLTLTPGAACPAIGGMPGSIALVATVTGSGSSQEWLLTLPGGDSQLSVDLRYVAPASVHGPLGTRSPTAALPGGLFVYFRGVVDGTLTRAADGRSEVLEGQWFGDLGVGTGPTDYDSLGSCTASNHRLTLRAR